MKEIWPNFFIVGAPRAGSTFLYDYLKQIPQVYMCPIKEPNYFAPNIDTKIKLVKPISNKKKYLKLFEKVKDEKAIGDVSPIYLWDPDAPKLIHQAVPEAKIIIILRNPVERAYSHYLLDFGFGEQTLPFKEAIKKALEKPENNYAGRIASASFYSEQLKRYQDTFKQEQIKIFIFEEFTQNIDKSIKELLNFIGVISQVRSSLNVGTNPVDVAPGKVSKYLVKNKILRALVRDLFPGESARGLRKIFRKKIEKPMLSSDDKKFMWEIYKEDVKKVEKNLGRMLPWSINED